MNKNPIKCVECGKFIKYSDLDEKRAKRVGNDHWDWFQEDMIEDVYFLCPLCKNK